MEQCRLADADQLDSGRCAARVVRAKLSTCPNDTVNGPGDCDSMAGFVAFPKDVLKLSFLSLISRTLISRTQMRGTFSVFIPHHSFSFDSGAATLLIVALVFLIPATHTQQHTRIPHELFSSCPNVAMNGPGDSTAMYVAIPKDVLKLSFLNKSPWQIPLWTRRRLEDADERDDSVFILHHSFSFDNRAAPLLIVVLAF